MAPGQIHLPLNERLLARYAKGSHVAEIREREITMFAALEWRVYIDGSMTESRMYHGDRVKDYGLELLGRRGVLLEDGWEAVELDNRATS